MEIVRFPHPQRSPSSADSPYYKVLKKLITRVLSSIYSSKIWMRRGRITNDAGSSSILCLDPTGCLLK